MASPVLPRSCIPHCSTCVTLEQPPIWKGLKGSVAFLAYRSHQQAVAQAQQLVQQLKGQQVLAEAKRREIQQLQISSGDQQWSTLPDSHYYYFSLAVIDSLLTSIGGRSDPSGGPRTNTLLSLTGEGTERQWSEVFPPMPTARHFHASVTTEQALVVTGGYHGSKRLNTVEVMNIPTKQWSTARHMPHPFSSISATICGDHLYLGGGYGEGDKPSQSVLTCSLPDLLRPQSLGAKLRTLSLANKPGVWRHIKDLPVTRSTLTTLGGHLVAIGGKDDSNNPIADVRRYDPQTDSWHVIMKMKTKRSLPLVAVLPEDRLIIVGGCHASRQPMDSVEIGSLPVSG